MGIHKPAFTQNILELQLGDSVMIGFKSWLIIKIEKVQFVDSCDITFITHTGNTRLIRFSNINSISVIHRLNVD